jgi:hypothetical protein
MESFTASELVHIKIKMKIIFDGPLVAYPIFW